MNDYLPPTVCLDGAAIRRIREEKKLTQLYVAKVVGVTTDTVSRWENNRYPTIKRENVMRLAEALEVPFEEILQGAGGEPSVPASPAPRRMLAVWLVAAGLLLALAVFLLFRGRPAVMAGIAAERLLPPHAGAASVLPVRIRLQLEGEGKGFILRERFPPGWRLVEASPPPSSIDQEQGTARWIIRSGEPRTIAYLLRLPATATPGVGTFRGEIIAGGDGRHQPVAVGGGVQVKVAPYLWADVNADQVIDDGEMLQASYLFDEMKDVAMDWKELEAIWDAGGYQWDSRRQAFIPRPPASN